MFGPPNHSFEATCLHGPSSSQTLRHRPTRRGSALPRTPVLLACIILLIVAYLVTGLRLRATYFADAGKTAGEPTAGTAEMANLQAAEAILSAVQTAVQAEELAKARAIVDRAVEQFPRDQTLWLARADLYLRLAYPSKEEDLPEPERDAFLRESYDSDLRALEIGPRTAETEFAAGSIARTLGNVDAAIAHFQAARQADGTVAAYPLNLAQVYFSQNQFEQSSAQATVSLALDPDQSKAWGMLAEIALRSNDPRMALQHLEKAATIEPKEPAWRHMQARAFNRLAQAQQAIDSLDALETEERFSRVSLQLAGEAYGLLRQPEKALARYEEALAWGVKDPEVMLDAATWAERLGNRSRALELATMARAEGLEKADRMIERLATPENTGG